MFSIRKATARDSKGTLLLSFLYSKTIYDTIENTLLNDKLFSAIIWHKNIWYHNVLCLAAWSCLTLGNPTDCGLRGSSVHGILQAGILEWVQAHLQGIFLTQRWTQVPCTAGRFFSIWATRKAHKVLHYITEAQKNWRHNYEQ